ncbi:MAG: squalene/phytoene synthase family protein [Tranquillimonas sp.]
MGVNACAELVRRGDPDRFLSAMAARPPARAVLFPIYAFNLEVARAPWLTAEPMIAEMRLQWWRDVLDEIAGGKPVRRHEVATPLAAALDAEGAELLDRLVAARRADIAAEPFRDEAALWAYLDATAGHLMWATARALGAAAPDEAALRALARAQGLANWFLAVPALQERGRQPLPDGRPEAVARLADEALRAMPRRLTGPAALAAWRARPLLKRARRDPLCVVDGRLGQSEFARRAGLLRAGLAGV